MCDVYLVLRLLLQMIPTQTIHINSSHTCLHVRITFREILKRIVVEIPSLVQSAAQIQVLFKYLW